MKMRLFILSLTVTTLAACGKKGGDSIESSPSALALTGAERISYADATVEQCSAGGTVYSIYLDNNNNHLLDGGDDVVYSQRVCNGINGINGLTTMINTNRVSTGLDACASGSGLQIGVGLDLNRNSILEPSEITTPQVLCDGVAGATGSAGSAGSNGYNAVFTTVPATGAECSAGGITIVMAIDSDRSGTVSVNDLSYSSVTICNGVNGQDGQDGQNGHDGQNGQDAPASAYTPIEPILACGNNVAYKEVLLRLSNGQVLGSFSNNVNGDMTRLSFLPDGTFMNTDNSGCTFSLSTSVDGHTRSISWGGQVQMSWPMQ